MLFPPRNTFGYVTGNVLTTRPTAAFGTSITPGNNAYGSYTEILSDASVTRDCYGILININSINVTALAKDSLTTIGIDTAGGTSYVDFIPNLLSSCAWGYTTSPGGHWYYFPVFIPAGTAIAAKGSVNNATVGTQRVAIWLFGAPSNPEEIIYGQGVESIGINTAASNGTTVTSGTTSEGAWTSLGSSVRNCFAWQFGMGCNDTTMANLVYHGDLSYGNGTNQVIIGRDKPFYAGATEQLGSASCMPLYCDVPAGSTLYGRLQCSGTADAALSMAAYGVF